MNHSFDIEHARLYGIPEAIIIQNFSFWITRNRANGTHQHDGRTWLYNSVKALGVLFPYMTGDQIRRTLESLEKKGVLVTGFYSTRPGDRTKWFAFADEAQFLPPVDHLAKTPNGPKKGAPDHLAKNPNGGEKGGNDHLAKSPNGLAENPNGIGKSAKSTKSTDITTDVTSNISPAELSPEELFELAWQAYPKRPGASKSDSLKAWNARLKAGADPLEIIAGVKAYAAYIVAKGSEPEFIKQPATFFGPGKHYLADWTPPSPKASGRPQPAPKFDPNDYVNSGAAYGPAIPAYPAADPFTIDAQFVERPA